MRGGCADAHCHTLLYVIYCYLWLFIYHSVPHTDVHCRTRLHTATHCRTLLHVINCYWCIIIYLIFSAAHCRTLPHTATHCYMLFILIYLLIIIYLLFSAAHCHTLPHTAGYRVIYLRKLNHINSYWLLLIHTMHIVFTY